MLAFPMQWVSAQVNVEKIWADYAGADLNIHYKFTIKGYKNQQCRITSYFYTGGNAINDKNNNYHTKSGKVCSSSKFTPGYDDCIYNDLTVTIPIEELHLEASRGSMYSAQNISHQVGISVIISCNGQTIYNDADQDTHYILFSYAKCTKCLGAKTCLGCMGTGRAFQGNSNYPCTMCGGYQTSCNRCNGSGIETHINGTTMCANLGSLRTNRSIDPNAGMIEGKIYYHNSGGYDDSSDSDYDHSDSYNDRNGTCPDCGGIGYRQAKYRYAAESSFAPYHNYSGNKCAVCGDYDEHYHYRCTTCKRR